MSRLPIQVLVIPFRKVQGAYEFCLLRRSDAGYWQFIAGGVEEGEETPEAARREANEELGLSLNAEIVRLDSVSSVPAHVFRDWKNWPDGTFVVKESAFGIEVVQGAIRLSEEHVEFKWCSYEKAVELLKWDSNKTALWELSQRLT